MFPCVLTPYAAAQTPGLSQGNWRDFSHTKRAHKKYNEGLCESITNELVRSACLYTVNGNTTGNGVRRLSDVVLCFMPGS